MKSPNSNHLQNKTNKVNGIRNQIWIRWCHVIQVSLVSKWCPTNDPFRLSNFFFNGYYQVQSFNLTFRTSCRDDILPSGLGDLGNEGGWSRGRAGAVRLAPGNELLEPSFNGCECRNVLQRVNINTNHCGDGSLGGVVLVVVAERVASLRSASNKIFDEIKWLF